MIPSVTNGSDAVTEEYNLLVPLIESLTAELSHTPCKQQATMIALLMYRFHEQDDIQHNIKEASQGMEYLSRMLAYQQHCTDAADASRIHSVIVLLQRMQLLFIELQQYRLIPCN